MMRWLAAIVPLCAAGLADLITSLAFAFICPSSPLRLLVLLIVGVLTYVYHVSMQDLIENRALRLVVTILRWIIFLKSIDDLCLTRISFDDRIRDVAKAGRDTSNSNIAIKQKMDAMPDGATAASPKKSVQGVQPSRFKWALFMLWNFRGVQTRWRIKNIPAYSQTGKPYITSKRAFLLHHLTALFLAFLVGDILGSLPPLPEEIVFSATRQHVFSRLSDITSEELFFRVVATALFWTSIFCSLTMIYSPFAIVQVGILFSECSTWPPYFGSFSEAYSLRKFWGVTWHQTFRRPFTGMSEFLASTVLRLPKHSLLARYTKLFMTFGISGLLHCVGDLLIEVPNDQSGTMHFYLMQALGITIEDGVQELSRRIGIKRNANWKKYLGYLWLIAFLVWTTPGWSFPIARNIDPRRDTFPGFSIII